MGPPFQTKVLKEGLEIYFSPSIEQNEQYGPGARKRPLLLKHLKKKPLWELHALSTAVSMPKHECEGAVFTRLKLVTVAVDCTDNLTITSVASACRDGSQLLHIRPI